MTIELPVFRLGLAGFDEAVARRISKDLSAASPGSVGWQVAPLPLADAYWVRGLSARMLPGDVLHVASAHAPDDTVIQLHLPGLTRPLALSLPVTHRGGFSRDALTFDASSVSSMAGMLGRFEACLSPLASQLCLASHLVDHQAALGPGVYELVAHHRVIAVVDMQGDAGVMPGMGPSDFENAHWRRVDGRAAWPEHFARTSLSELMWNHATRSRRDLLPGHYRSGLLYFRRLPLLPSHLLQESHLSLMRELRLAPATFLSLRQRTGLGEVQLARDLASLYFVGSITSNPKRALRGNRQASQGDSSSGAQSVLLPSSSDSALPDEGHTVPRSQLTVPAPLRKP